MTLPSEGTSPHSARAGREWRALGQSPPQEPPPAPLPHCSPVIPGVRRDLAGPSGCVSCAQSPPSRETCASFFTAPTASGTGPQVGRAGTSHPVQPSRQASTSETPFLPSRNPGLILRACRLETTLDFLVQTWPLSPGARVTAPGHLPNLVQTNEMLRIRS